MDAYDDRTPALYELATMGEPMRPRGACARRPQPERPFAHQIVKIGLARAQELAAHQRIARWADSQVSHNCALDRYFASDHAGPDWPEDH